MWTVDGLDVCEPKMLVEADRVLKVFDYDENVVSADFQVVLGFKCLAGTLNYRGRFM